MPTYRFRDIAAYAHAARLRRGEWQPWFAWHPVITEKGRVAWLATLMRCEYQLLEYPSTRRVRSYMAVSDYLLWRLTATWDVL